MTTLVEIEVSYKPNRKSQTSVTSSFDAYNAFSSVWNENEISYRESFKVLFLNRANVILGFSTISEGGTTGTVVDAKMVFGIALKCAASAIILAHNHPSGVLKPSTADDRMTSKLVRAGELLDIPVLDHIILSDQGYYSYGDEGKI
ncbi:MAG: JAB domain-containing protein [Flavobacteriales bacterium]|nr:JAB domain-containing protein [Flavobacteriales bacterium]